MDGPGTRAGTRDRILIVDDDPDTLKTLKRILPDWEPDLQFVFAQGGASAPHELRTGRYAVVVSDIDNRFIHGEDFLKAARTAAPDVARVVLSS